MPYLFSRAAAFQRAARSIVPSWLLSFFAFPLFRMFFEPQGNCREVEVIGNNLVCELCDLAFVSGNLVSIIFEEYACRSHGCSFIPVNERMR